jgi:hypothetical protein
VFEFYVTNVSHGIEGHVIPITDLPTSFTEVGYTRKCRLQPLPLIYITFLPTKITDMGGVSTKLGWILSKFG